MYQKMGQYWSHYKPLVDAFCESLLKEHPAEFYTGMPQLFLPISGDLYEQSALKMAIAGIETLRWGKLGHFLENPEAEQRSSFAEIRNLDFTGWTCGRQHTFWGFVMYFLASLYGVKNWEVMKRRECQEILRSFVYANMNSMEKYKASSIKKGVNHDVWRQVKAKSAPFDSIMHLMELFNPQVVVLLGRNYWNYIRLVKSVSLEKGKGFEILEVEHNGRKCLVFCLPHPRGMIRGSKTAYYSGVLREEIMKRGLMVKLDAFTAYEKANEKMLALLSSMVSPKSLPDIYDAIAVIAVELCKQEASIPVTLLFDMLNKVGYRTTYGTEYAGGRGSYTVIRHAYWKYANAGDSATAKAIALAFRRPNGEYAYEM